MSPTSHDIARAAGVSQSTVSRALGGDGRVAPETRRRVSEIAAQLGYAPNAAARSLVTNRSQTIGVVVDDLRNPFFPELIDDLHTELVHAAFHTVLVDDRESRGPGPIAAWAPGELDGLVFVSARTWSRSPGVAAARGIPVILLNRESDEGGVDSVVSDNRMGGALAAEHLLALGHRRIALISGPGDTSTAREREDGFRRALEARGVALAPHLRREGSYSHQTGHQCAGELLNGPERPTSIFCGNDVMAFGALDAALARGISVPHDVSIVGYDDVAQAGWRTMSLTTVRQPLSPMARMAARMLVGRARATEPLEPRRHVFPAGLVQRSSTAPPRP